MSIMADTTTDELVAMSALTDGKMPTYAEATVEDLADVVRKFADAAVRIQAAGLDGLEVHAGHGYLLDTFLSVSYTHLTLPTTPYV